MIDEVHLLGESERGSALEAGVVSRIKMVSKLAEMREVRQAVFLYCPCFPAEQPADVCMSFAASCAFSSNACFLCFPNVHSAVTPVSRCFPVRSADAPVPVGAPLLCTLQMPLGQVRFVAVSATIPNVRDIAQWLLVPPEGLKEFGEEVRPVKLRTLVRQVQASEAADPGQASAGTGTGQ